jgi:hypothetical protein
MRWARYVARRDRRGIHVGYWWESQKEKPIGRPRRRWVDNIKMDVKEIECGGMDRIDLAEDGDQWRALMNKVMNLRVHKMLGSY